MKHAYLIMAHNNWEQLKQLIRLLDYPQNDIYMHIDKKSNSFQKDEFEKLPHKSKIFIFQEIKNYWGSYTQVKCELLLFEEASKTGYDYYHLISGADLPIKSQDYIHRFFEEHNGLEFIHYDTNERLKNDAELGRRTKLYHFLQNYRRRYRIRVLNEFFTFCERVLLVLQLILHVNRLKDKSIEIRYGSQWVSITHDLVNYILSNKKLIEDMFQYTNCSDELFIQTLVYNSKFRNKLFNQKYDNSIESNMRLIDWKRGNNGNPYIWRVDDTDKIEETSCLFARKFDLMVDEEIINYISESVKK